MLEVSIEEGNRDPLHDSQLWLLVGVRSQVRRAQERQEELRLPGQREVTVGGGWRIEPVARTLDRKQGRAGLREVIAIQPWYPGAGQDHGGPHTAVEVVNVVSGGQRAGPTVG